MRKSAVSLPESGTGAAPARRASGSVAFMFMAFDNLIDVYAPEGDYTTMAEKTEHEKKDKDHNHEHGREHEHDRPKPRPVPQPRPFAR